MKKLFLISLVLLLCGSVFGDRFGNVYHEVTVKDEVGVTVTTITSVEIYLPSTTTNAVIYKSRNKVGTITIPMTTGSTNTTLVSGVFSWWGPSDYAFSLTDGTNIVNSSGHRNRSSSEGIIILPSYITAISTTNYADGATITMGTSGDWVFESGTTPDLLKFTPATDGAVFRIGNNDAATNADFRVYVGTDLGLLIDEGAPSFTWNGGVANINASSNFNTNINTGSSTGAISIGNSAAGIITIDSTTTMTVNSDAAMSLTTSDGSADITVDATAGSVIIDGGEAVDDAVVIRATGAAGGIDITSLGDIDITTTGAAGEDITITNTGGSVTITATEAIADAIGVISSGGVDITAAATFDIDITAVGGKVLITPSEAAADQFKVDATGTVAGFAIVFETTNGGIQLNADDGSNGDITIDAADILTLTSADVKIFDGAVTETWEIEGTANGFETTIVFTDPTADGTITFPDTGDEGAAGGEIAWIADGGSATKDGTNAALPVTDALVLGTSTGASAWSLPNGEEGQILTVVIVTDGGEAIITPDTTNASWATVVLTDDIDGVTFQYIDDTIGWMIIGTSGDGTNVVAVTQ